MRIFLIIDETNFYQPDFVADLLRNTDDEYVGAALVTKVPAKHNIEKYMTTHWYYLTPTELLKLGFKKISFGLKDLFLKKSKEGKFYSVKSVFKYFDIDFFEVKTNINRPEYLQLIRQQKPDVIISSNSLIFGKELLRIPKYCINRHSALLPSYGGLWPVFQAVRSGEQKVGVTVHTMEKKIDKGNILAQKEIQIDKYDTIDSLYQKCFKISAQVTIAAIKKIESGDFPSESVTASNPPSYFSFPSIQDWREFRKRGKRFI